MKIIKPSVEFLGAVPTDYAGALCFIEAAGRTCYKSEDNITNTSTEQFVKRLIKAGHLAMVEHSNFVVRCELPAFSISDPWKLSKYLTVFRDSQYLYIGGNITAWINRTIEVMAKFQYQTFASCWGDFLGWDHYEPHQCWQICPHDEIPKELHRYSARFICDRGVSHELVRHRPCSFAQESTRYVSYGGKGMEFIEPEGFEDWNVYARGAFEACCIDASYRYNFMLDEDLKPQQARTVLPNALKTEIVVTADATEWRHIRNLRTDKAAHPDMQRVMNMIPWDDFL